MSNFCRHCPSKQANLTGIIHKLFRKSIVVEISRSWRCSCQPLLGYQSPGRRVTRKPRTISEAIEQKQCRHPQRNKTADRCEHGRPQSMRWRMSRSVCFESTVTLPHHACLCPHLPKTCTIPTRQWEHTRSRDRRSKRLFEKPSNERF